MGGEGIGEGGSLWPTVALVLEDPYNARAVLADSLARLDRAGAGADGGDAERRWVLRIAHQDALVVAGTADDDALAELFDEVPADAGGGALRPWLQTILVERAASRFDPLCVPLAVEALATLPGEPLIPRLALQARGRLQRVLAIVGLVAPGDHVAVSDRRYAHAIADFHRCGLETQAALTTLGYSLIRVIAVGHDPLGHLARARDARVALAERASALALEGELLFLLLALILGERDAYVDGIDRFEELSRQPAFARSESWVPTVLRSLRTLVHILDGDDGPDSRRRFDAVIGDIRVADPWIYALTLHAATVLYLDLGNLEAAREYWARAQAYPGRLTDAAHGEDIVSFRLRLLAGDVSAVGPYKDLLNELVVTGRDRAAADNALRAARDCRRAGDRESAVLLRDFALGHLPPAAECTTAERSLVAELSDLTPGPGAGPDEAGVGPAPTARPADPAPALAVAPGEGAPGERTRGVRVRVLTPRIEVSVDGVDIDLLPSVDRLLAALLVLPSPFTVDQLTESLWPGAEAAAGRRRLASALHRLRSRLGLGRDELVTRRGDALVVSVPPHWDVDLVAFRAALRRGDDEQRVACLRAVTGVAGSVQFAYDDALADARHALVADWLDAARDLCRRGVCRPDELVPAARALGLEERDLTARG